MFARFLLCKIGGCRQLRRSLVEDNPIATLDVGSTISWCTSLSPLAGQLCPRVRASKWRKLVEGKDSSKLLSLCQACRDLWIGSVGRNRGKEGIRHCDQRCRCRCLLTLLIFYERNFVLQGRQGLDVWLLVFLSDTNVFDSLAMAFDT